jgi:hypothetical protein
MGLSGPRVLVHPFAAAGLGRAKLFFRKWMDRTRIQRWGCSSVGRAVALQAIGQEFESPQLHQPSLASELRLGRPARSNEGRALELMEFRAGQRACRAGARERKGGRVAQLVRACA